MIPTEIILKVGKNLQIESNDISLIIQSENINRLSNLIWSKELAKLTNSEIIFLFKGIVYLENEFNWTGGSVAGGIWIYREIQNRGLDNDFSVANWSLLNSKNEYIPFGSTNYNSKNIVEYFRAKSNISHRRSIEIVQKEKRLLALKIEGFEKKIEKLLNEIEYLKNKLLLSNKNIKEMSEIILCDNTKPIYFYHSEIEKILNDENVEVEILIKILSKFKEKEKRNTKVLKTKIEQKIKISANSQPSLDLEKPTMNRNHRIPTKNMR